MSNEVTIIESNPQDTALYLITKAEIDQSISTAKAYPRSLKTFMDSAMSMATLTEDIAQSCVYALPRGGKALEGPSVRLAEIVSSTYGNIRAGARVIDNDGKTITAQGICHDLESNYSVTVEVKRSILQNEWKNGAKTGKMVPMNEDMQVVTGNAACAIAFRNAVFKVIPAALVSGVYESVKLVAKGTAQTLSDRRSKAVEWFNEQGVKNEQICKVLGLKKVEDIDLDKLSILSGMRSAIKNGESTIKELFQPAETVSLPKITDKQLSAAITEIAAGNTTPDEVATLFSLTDEQLEALNAVKPI